MIQSVYNYLIPQFMSKPVSVSNNTHKTSELRSLYTHIINMNKRSPLYKISLSDDSQLFAISLKESSMSFHAALSELSDPEASPFNMIKPASENPDKVAANFVSEDISNLPEPFTVELKSLAMPQVNVGRSVPKDSPRPRSGSYSFVVNVEEERYEFQFNIKPDSSNEEILNKLAKFMNRSDIGVTASVKKIDRDYIAFSIASESTGDIGESIFTLEDTNAPEYQQGLVEFYGLNHIEREASNAQFSFSGEDSEALTNHLVLNHSLQLDFYEASEEPIRISYIPDSDKILKHIRNFRDEYNEIIQLAKNYPSNQGHSEKLVREMKQSLFPYKNEMEACGFSFDKDNFLQLDESLARQSIEEGDMQKLFSADHGMTRTLLRKSSSMTINPMDYVDKKLIVYPDYSRQGICHPYSATMYSGMLFNYYC